ncbi:MAG: CoB--CoM heterodisulfide reductase iron-sulfur subunit B family protein [Theionarchaea archaeon]|nr:CoB--CoM heterodisulfide reductase iron-sulfur subunit B family protein [Theionarchaea archaeon]MBU7038436.1 CoB--CoM heterodisulfide reductase iron-sulfur subunit B family protein [Theionarchaea archaeon]
MKIPYYPGCTLKTTAKPFEDTTKAVSEAVGIELIEMPRWNCCGTVYSLASDDLMHQLAPIRNLIRVQDMGYDRVTTLCSMCYNTLEQANQLVKSDPEKLEKMNSFMDQEEDYTGGVTVVHYLTVLKEMGFDSLPVKNPLKGLTVVPYYGCLLLRPEEISIDNPERPTVMAELLTSLGATVVDYPYKLECCGSYHTVNHKEVVCEKTYHILSSARKRGAEAVVLSCPLCEFNLDFRQKDLEQELAPMPILYFSQLLAISLGLFDALEFDQHYVDPKPLLKEKGLLR